MTDISVSGKVENLKREIRRLPQYEPLTEHVFHGGMYCRQMYTEAGVTVVGKVHKKEHFFMLVTGSLIVVVDDIPHEITAPCLLTSGANTRRVIYSLTDAIYMTIHQTESDTVEDAENELVIEEPDCPFGVGNVLKRIEGN